MAAKATQTQARIAGAGAVGVVLALVATTIFSSVQPVTLNAGQQIAIKCPNGKVANSHNGDHLSNVKCVPTPSPSSSASASPSAAPTATPSPTPTPTPSPTPTPTATPSPTASPTGCTRTFSGDNTGMIDVTAALQSFLAAAGGSVSCLAPGGTYRIGGGLHTSGLSNATIDGQGATIFQSVASGSRVLLIDTGGDRVTIRNLTIAGTKIAPYGKWLRSQEANHCLQFGGVTNVLVENFTCRNVGGDGIYLSGGANRWMDQVVIRNSTMDNTGRMGVAITDGVSHLTYTGNTLRGQGYYCMDVEPNGATVAGRLAGLEDAEFSNNVCGPKPYGDYPADTTQADGFAWVATNASGGGTCNRINVFGNSVTDPNPKYQDFRWGNPLGCQNLNLTTDPTANVRQVKH
jgi:hypothetical protein